MDADRHAEQPSPAPPEPLGYQEQRPANIRKPTPGHPYAHHIRTLPARLGALSAELKLPLGGKLLDFGCADVPYRHFFGADVQYVAADLPGNPLADVTLNPDGTLPTEDDGFDGLMSTQVLEHVTDPALYLAECFRVLRPGGRMLLSTHGVFVYHPDPQDLWRWTCEGLTKVVSDAGFEIERFEGIIGLVPTGLQLVQDGLWGRVPERGRPLFARIMQAAVGLADRAETQQSRDYNGQVFALVASKPLAT